MGSHTLFAGGFRAISIGVGEFRSRLVAFQKRRSAFGSRTLCPRLNGDPGPFLFDVKREGVFLIEILPMRGAEGALPRAVEVINVQQTDPRQSSPEDVPEAPERDVEDR